MSKVCEREGNRDARRLHLTILPRAVRADHERLIQATFSPTFHSVNFGRTFVCPLHSYTVECIDMIGLVIVHTGAGEMRTSVAWRTPRSSSAFLGLHLSVSNFCLSAEPTSFCLKLLHSPLSAEENSAEMYQLASQGQYEGNGWSRRFLMDRTELKYWQGETKACDARHNYTTIVR